MERVADRGFDLVSVAQSVNLYWYPGMRIIRGGRSNARIGRGRRRSDAKFSLQLITAAAYAARQVNAKLL